ncbi:hypothetical protein M752DRAFT_276144 [Aspergillus phoenicis ATCC 13157]|uniref:Uncharacterized protein n=1 Tax=Aspergillus phoenicis ATCC 13157 TaxID=1353007 RepID=A0A370PLI0_ASPPH|nr:hypothetical protein M752DRAFT_276144 [Aspergillus phoenicis ATCC 13157]
MGRTLFSFVSLFFSFLLRFNWALFLPSLFIYFKPLKPSRSLLGLPSTYRTNNPDTLNYMTVYIRYPICLS